MVKDERESRLNAANNELQGLREELEKVKKGNKDAQRKDENFRDLREKLEQYHLNEKSLIEEK